MQLQNAAVFNTVLVAQQYQIAQASHRRKGPPCDSLFLYCQLCLSVLVCHEPSLVNCTVSKEVIHKGIVSTVFWSSTAYCKANITIAGVCMTASIMPSVVNSYTRYCCSSMIHKKLTAQLCHEDGSVAIYFRSLHIVLSAVSFIDQGCNLLISVNLRKTNVLKVGSRDWTSEGSKRIRIYLFKEPLESSSSFLICLNTLSFHKLSFFD